MLISIGIVLDISQSFCPVRAPGLYPAPFPGRMSYKATKPGLVSVFMS